MLSGFRVYHIFLGEKHRLFALLKNSNDIIDVQFEIMSFLIPIFTIARHAKNVLHS